MRRKRATPDQTLAELAARQHGVVTLAQLSKAGIGSAGVSRRVAAGRLHRIHRGVYALGNPNLTREGHWMAAALACGPNAVLSHETAAALWGISPKCPAVVHVTVSGGNGRRRRRGIVVHRSKTLTVKETTRHRGLPVTSHARTLRDLGLGEERTKSDLERLFLRICRSHGIPNPEVNVPIGRYTVDFLWRPHRLVAEVDGYAYHSDRAAFRADRARDRYLSQRGLVVLRYADTELADEPSEVATSLQTALRRRVRPPAG